MLDYDVKVEPPKDGRAKPKWMRQSEETATWLDARLGVRFWTLTGIVVAGLVFGTPHLLVTYHCIGPCSFERAHSCDYFGVWGWRVATNPVHGGCPVIRLL